MNRKEFLKVFSYLTAAIEKQPSKETIEVYYDMLRELDADLAMAAVKKVIAQEQYPVLPTIGKIMTAARDLCNMNRLTPGEAWGKVQRVIGHHGYYGEAEAVAELPAEVAEVVKWMGWADLCHSEKPDVIRAQFMRMYETQEARQREMEMLPVGVKEIVQGMGEKLKLPGVE